MERVCEVGAGAFLVVGYDGGAVARISFPDRQRAGEARQRLIQAMTTSMERGVSPYVHVTAEASLLATHVVFVYVEDAENSYWARLP
jgi:hypothetical protein